MYILRVSKKVGVFVTSLLMNFSKRAMLAMNHGEFIELQIHVLRT